MDDTNEMKIIPNGLAEEFETWWNTIAVDCKNRDGHICRADDKWPRTFCSPNDCKGIK
jgi:hypothetical protein